MERTNLFETLKERGYVYQTTDEEKVRALCNGEPTTVYVGIDPTADSLHIGHFFSLMMIKYFQDAGHKVIVLIGGATALVGDPSGRSDMRKMNTKEQVEYNLNQVKQIVSKFLNTTGNNPGMIVNNADWFKGYDYVDFMRDIGTHFNVNTMLASEAYKRRLEQGGLTFLEMGYMLMQSYDFIHLNKEFGCTLQIGGSDQWGNMIGGVELARKLNAVNGTNIDLEALTCPLLTNSEGQKMGKTAKGALWVAKDKTSVYDFYQYFYNVQDKDVMQLLKLFTRLPISEIQKIMDGDIREAKKIMAFEITKLVHGEEEATKALEASNALFGGGIDMSNVPTFEYHENCEIKTLADLLVATSQCASKSEARRMCEQGAVSVKGTVVKDWSLEITPAIFDDGELLIKKGKKSFVNVVLK